MIDYEGMPVSLIDYDDLKRIKLATGRAVDAADIQAIEKQKKAP